MEEVQKEDTEKKAEEPAEQEEAKEEEKSTEEAKKAKPAQEKKTEKKTENKTEEGKGSKRQKTMQCKVTLLDDTQFECELDVRDLTNYCIFCLCKVTESSVCLFYAETC